VALPAAPTPTVKLGGNSISGTQSVVVGQQIALSGSVSLPLCMSMSSQQWSVPGTTVGGFNTAALNGGPEATNFTQATNTFYWVTSGNSLSVTYQYTMSGGGGTVTSPAAPAAFNVAGPTSPSTGVTLGTINISNNKLVFGGSGTNIGILFTPSASAPSGYSNTWV
jgi:hypothetical protein